VLQSVRTELGAEKIAHERSDQALRDAQLTITNLTEKLHIAQQSLTMVKAELAAKRQQARKGRRKPLVASPTDAPAGGGEQPTQPVRKPRGRRATATLVKMVGKPGRAAAKASHPSRMAGKTVTKKVARSKEPKPVKWWLGR
jgi:hypothetical protein